MTQYNYFKNAFKKSTLFIVRAQFSDFQKTRCENSLLRNVLKWHTRDCGVTGEVKLFRWFQFSFICLFKGSVEHKTKPCKMFGIGFMKTAGVGHKGGEEPHDPFIFHFWLLERIRLFYCDSRLL